MTAIDPSFLTSGAEWSVGIGTEANPSVGGGGGFGKVLGEQLQGLADLQTDAAEQSRALATGQAVDPTEVVTAVERARLAMQLASQLRTKSVEAIQDVMRTQV